MLLPVPPAAERKHARFPCCPPGGSPPGPEIAALRGCVLWRARCPAGAPCLQCSALACVNAVQHEPERMQAGAGGGGGGGR